MTMAATLSTPYDLVPDPEDFDREESDYLAAEDLEIIASRLIAERDQVRFAGKFRILYRWRREAPVTRGNVTMGACNRTTGLLAHFAEADYVIWLAADAARDYKLTPSQVEALLFHELLHVIPNVEGKPSLRGHDAECFAAEIEAYGLWFSHLKRIGEAVQLSMGLDGGR